MASSEVLERLVDETGLTYELHRRGEAYDVVVDGTRQMASDERRAERSLIELTLAPLRDRDDVSLLLAGLGMGYTLRAALDSPNVKRVDVVEASRAIVDWEARYFAALNGDALKDPRVKLHTVELGAFLKQVRLGSAHDVPPELAADGWLALVLDVGEGPASPGRPGNEQLYTDEGLERLEGALRPGGVLALWSAQREPELVRRMHARLQNVAEVAVPIDLDGQAGLDYVYRGRRHPPVSRKPTN
jgi:spermidine synthase